MCTFIYTYAFNAYTYIYIYIHICIHICMYVYICIIYACMYHMYIHTYIYIGLGTARGYTPPPFRRKSLYAGAPQRGA